MRPNPVETNEILGYKRNEMKKGEAFGEKAIMATDPSLAKRTASAYAESDCEFIVIHRNDFLFIMGKFDKEKEFKNSFLLKNIPPLGKVASAATLENFLYSFKEIYVGKNGVITREGAICEEVFFLVEGTCVVKRSYEWRNMGPFGKKSDFIICSIGEF